MGGVKVNVGRRMADWLKQRILFSYFSKVIFLRSYSMIRRELKLQYYISKIFQSLRRNYFLEKDNYLLNSLLCSNTILS